MTTRPRKPRHDSKNCSIVNRTVSFNIADPFQKQLLEYVDTWVNFSGTIKRLLTSQVSVKASNDTTYNSAFDWGDIVPPISLEAYETGDYDPLSAADGLL